MRPFILALLMLAVPSLVAQATPPTPDTLVFINGEQLTGSLLRADSKGITFKSLMAGELSVAWTNVKELRSDKDFAVMTTSEKLTRKNASAIVPQGKITVEDKQLTVATTTGPKVIPLGKADRVVDAAAFDKAVNRPPDLLHNWDGTVNGGVSLVRATENVTTFNGSVNLIRSTPTVDWLPPRSRSNLDYNQSYGSTSQPATPTIKTNIFHADAERDDYFSPRLFFFGVASFDHNFSQALDLQQSYGGGVGITLLKNAHRQLDFKGDIHYEKQAFFVPTQDQNLIGSTFSEKYLRYLIGGIVFNEFGSISPSWNNTNAYSAHINAGFTFPVYKNLGFFINGIDDYLNNAPIGSKKNSQQYNTGISYTLKPH